MRLLVHANNAKSDEKYRRWKQQINACLDKKIDKGMEGTGSCVGDKKRTQ